MIIFCRNMANATALSCIFTLCLFSPVNGDITSLTSTSISTSADDFLLDLDMGTVSTGTAAAPGSAVVDLTAGGTLELADWALFNAEPANGTVGDTLILPYSSGSADSIQDTFVQGDSTGGTVSSNSGSNGWWDTIVEGTTNDGDTGLRASRVDGSIDLSAYDSGVVYFFTASFENTDRIQVRVLGGDYADNSIVDDPSGPGGWVRAASFDTSDFSTLEWQYRNSDNDSSPGSRARFAGFAVFSSVSTVPEPGAASLLALGTFILAARRKR